MTIRALIAGVMERRTVERRAPALTAGYDQAVAMIRDTKYTGQTVTHWAEGIPKKIEFPNPVTIDVTRKNIDANMTCAMPLETFQR